MVDVSINVCSNVHWLHSTRLCLGLGHNCGVSYEAVERSGVVEEKT
jgi:hypothetical protein